MCYGKHILPLEGYSMLSLQVEEIHCNKAEKLKYMTLS